MRKLKELWPWLLCLACWVFAVAALASCSAGKAVVVPETKTTVVHGRDTVWRTDSFRESRTTIIQQADSALMAQFGIRLGKMERAWLVRQAAEREGRGSVTFVSRRDSVVHDSIPVPYPKEVYKDRKLSRWQGFVMCMGYGMVALLAVFMAAGVVCVIIKLKSQFSKLKP